MRTRHLVTTLLLVGPAALVVGWMVLGLGGFSTRAEPSLPERVVAGAVRRWATPREARNAKNPVPFAPDVWAEARAHFADHCATCHGNDGRGATELGKNLYPRAPDMTLPHTQALSDGELYWIIENGVRLTGMPAWGDGTDHDRPTWTLVHFIRHLSELSEAQLDEMQALNPRSPAEIAEEQQDKDFLSGAQPDRTPSTLPHHQHQE